MSSQHTRTILNQVFDPSDGFISSDNTVFMYDKVDGFNKDEASGTLSCTRMGRKNRLAFNLMEKALEPVEPWEFPPVDEEIRKYPFDLSFINETTLRIRINSQEKPLQDKTSMMLSCKPESIPADYSEYEDAIEYAAGNIKVKVEYDPFHLLVTDENGEEIICSHNSSDSKCLKRYLPCPVSFARNSLDMSRNTAFTFNLAHDEMIYGCGESFTRLNKRGQRINLFTTDANSVQTKQMYKPIPFFMSSRGYGMLVHSTYPMTFDFGAEYDGAATIYNADPVMDIFLFTGDPKSILNNYTALTGRSPVPPLWSFGLWMSRITYKSEDETREVARKLRNYKIPCDVIHLDTGWFEHDWQCDFEFSQNRFKNVKRFIEDLRKSGFRISLWQLPYFTELNKLHGELLEKELAVLGQEGGSAVEDAILDFSNPETVRWYEEKLTTLFDLGVSAIKADFGEGAPVHGRYHSGKSGLSEHNLYPLRYNKTVFEATKKATGDGIIWARSAWAGSQRYPIHWGGDAENTDSAMAASLRAGISLGLCGFSFWSHDIGGFVKTSPEELYERWLPFGMLTSHSRCHGAPPKEPWEYSDDFVDSFRKSVNMKYTLMPYVYSQAVKCSQTGLPMTRALFVEFPDDRNSWMIEDQYMFGDQFLVAPLFLKDSSERLVYLPPGKWIDYQSGQQFEGGWHKIKAGEIPVILLVKNNSAIPTADIAQFTGEINWRTLTIKTFADKASGTASGYLAIPDDSLKGSFTIDSNRVLHAEKQLEDVLTDANIV